MQVFVAAQNLALETSAATATTFPAVATAVLSDVSQYVSVYVSCNVGTDVPALERLTVIGY